MSEQIQEQGPPTGRNVRAMRTGEVVSAKGDKTLVVRVTRRVRHPQAVDELGAHAQLGHPRRGFRATAVHDDDASTRGLQSRHVSEGRVVRAKRAAADLDEHCPHREAGHG